jgi:hypothetical protein
MRFEKTLRPNYRACYKSRALLMLEGVEEATGPIQEIIYKTLGETRLRE